MNHLLTYLLTRTSRFFVIKFNCFVYDSSYLPLLLRRVVKCETSEDVASGVANVIRRVFESAGKLRIFRRRSIVGILTNKANIIV